MMKNWKVYTISQLAEIIKYINKDLINDPNQLAEKLRQIAFKIGSNSKS